MLRGTTNERHDQRVIDGSEWREKSSYRFPFGCGCCKAPKSHSIHDPEQYWRRFEYYKIYDIYVRSTGDSS